MKKKRFTVDGKIYEIPDTEVASFIKDFPNAVEVSYYEVGGKKYNIPLAEVATFETDMGIKKKVSGNGLPKVAPTSSNGASPTKLPLQKGDTIPKEIGIEEQLPMPEATLTEYPSGAPSVATMGGVVQMDNKQVGTIRKRTPIEHDREVVLPTIREIAKRQQSLADNPFQKTEVPSFEQAKDSEKYFAKKGKEKEKLTANAIKNTTIRSLRNKGINAPEGSPIYNLEYNEYERKVRDGDAIVGLDKYNNFAPGLTKSIFGWEAFQKGWHEASEANDIAEKWANEWTSQQKVEYLKTTEQNKPTEYIGEKVEGWLGATGEFGGGAVPFVGKALIGAGIGAAAVAAAPGTAGASLAGLPTALAFILTAGDMKNHGQMEEARRRFDILKNQYPEMDDVEAMDIAVQGELAGGVTGILTNTLFMQAPSKPIISIGGKNVIAKTLQQSINSGLHMGAVTGTLEGVKQLEGNLEGIPTDLKTVVRNSINTAVENFNVGTMLTLLMHGIPNVAKATKSSIKYGLKDVPKEEITETLKLNEEAGRIPEGSAEKIVNDITEYQTALSKTSNGLSEQSRASVAGLIQKRMHIEAEAKDKDVTAQPLYKERIDAINQQIADIQRTNKPFEHEIDEATGETYEKQTFDNVAERTVNDLAEKISKGKSIEDAADIKAEQQFPEQLDKALNRIAKEEKSKNKDSEKPNTELSDNIEKYLEGKKPKDVEPIVEPIVEPTATIVKGEETVINPKDRPTLRMGDLEGMDEGAKKFKTIKTKDGEDIVLKKNEDGEVYAINSEKEVVGFATKLSDTETDLSVVTEYQQKGIGTELLVEFKKLNPEHQTGGLTPLGKKTLESANRKLPKEKEITNAAENKATEVLNPETKSLTPNEGTNKAIQEEQGSSKQEKINEIIDLVAKHDKARKNSHSQREYANELKLKAAELGFNVKKNSSGSISVTNESGNKLMKKNTETNQSLAKDFNPEKYSTETNSLIEGIKSGKQPVIGLIIEGIDGRKLSIEQTKKALKDLQDGKITNAVKGLYDALEKYNKQGFVELIDYDTRQKTPIPLEDYFEGVKEFKEGGLTDEQFMQLNYELNQDYFNFNSELYGQDFIHREIEQPTTRTTKENTGTSNGGENRAGLNKEALQKAQSEHDKSVAALQKAEDGITSKNASQTDLFKGTQQGLFNVEAAEAKNILDPLRKKVKETKSELDKAQKDYDNSLKEEQPNIFEAEPPKPPTEPPTTTPIEEGGKAEGEGIGVTHADTEVMRKETGLPEYEKTPQTLELWNAEADKRINNGEMPTLIKKLENGGSLAEGVEQTMMGKYIAALDAEVTKNPSKENIEKFDKAMHLNEVAGSLGFGQVGRARQQTFLPENSLGKSLLDEAQSLGIRAAELPKEVKDKVIAEHEELAKIRVELEKANEENIRLQNELAAKEEVAKIRKAAKKTNKTAADFVAERKTLKDELIAAKEKHEKWLKDNGIQKAGFGFTLTVDMAKIIGKMIKSHTEQTVIKFDELVNKVFDEIKDVFSGLEKKDIIDVMRGVYNEKRPTRNEAVARLRDFKSEAVLLKKLEDVRLGKEPESVQRKSQRAVRLTELENKIKEIRERNKDKDPVEKTDAERLSAKRKFIAKSIAEIEADVKAGKLGNEKRLPPIRLDKKTEALQDRLITIETQQNIRREKADYEKMSGLNKAADTFWQIAGLRRLVNAAIDFSILFRQASPVTMNIMKYLPRIENGKLIKNTAPKAIANMFRLAFDPKGFKRFQYNLEKSELGRMYTHFNGVFSNPTEVKMEKREEEFVNNLLPRLRQKIDASNNEGLKKAADIVDKAWFSERAAAGLLNTIRVEEFTKGAKNLQREGITPENSPQHYKDLVKWTMNLTGRGNMLKLLEDSHAGRITANRTYFGARLFAAKVNMLNPVTYVRMPKEVRVQALKDMAGNVTTMVLVGLAAQAAGASVSFNPDDPDFLQVRFNDKVYDITGGSVAYVRTFLRTVKASVMQISNPGSKAANSYTGFAGRSAWNSLFANKLSPNTAYAYHFFTGKSGEYDEKGKKKPFDPAEIAEIYPLYVDGTVEAYKKGGIGDALMILIPDLIGIGTQQYEDKDNDTKGATRKKLPSRKQLQEQ